MSSRAEASTIASALFANRSSTLAIIALTMLTVPAEADWAPQGNPVGAGTPARVCSDGAGGAFISRIDSWSGGHWGPDYAWISLHRLNANGAPPLGWPAHSVYASGRPMTDFVSSDLASDGFGGAFVAWSHGERVLLTRVLADGRVHLDWPDSGLVICSAPYRKHNVRVAADGLGGAFVVWSDERNEYNATDLYLQHISGQAEVVVGWDLNGNAIDLSPGSQWDAWVVRGEDNGAIVAWAGPAHVRVQHLTAGGNVASGWPPEGVTIHMGGVMDVTLVEDGSGGAVVGWVGSPELYGPMKVRSRRVSADGVLDGELQLTGDRHGVRTLESVADGAGGVVFAWTDESDAGETMPNQARVRCGRVELGWPCRVAPGWPIGGVRASTRSGSQAYGLESVMAPAADGGCFLVFEVWTLYDGDYICAQRLNGDGSLGWGEEGIVLGIGLTSGPGSGRWPAVAAVNYDQAIAAWSENSHVYAQLLGIDGPVPVLLSLVEAEATTEGVLLSWYAKDAASLGAVVERRTAWSPWEALGPPQVEGLDQLRCEDRTAIPGERYGYRLRYWSDGAESFSEEVWLDVPGLTLSLAGLRPNPARAPGVIAFTLPNSEPADLLVVDPRGRIVWSRDVGSLGPGSHALELGGELALRPGVYWIRLRHSLETITARGVVLH